MKTRHLSCAIIGMLIFIRVSNAYALGNIHTPLQIFISSSMPDFALRQLFKESKVIPANFILRGLVKNSLIDTQKFIMKLNDDEMPSISIDPIAFEQYQIEQVPSFVKTDEECSTFGGQKMTCRYAKISGMIGIHVAREYLNKREFSL